MSEGQRRRQSRQLCAAQNCGQTAPGGICSSVLAAYECTLCWGGGRRKGQGRGWEREEKEECEKEKREGRTEEEGRNKGGREVRGREGGREQRRGWEREEGGEGRRREEERKERQLIP